MRRHCNWSRTWRGRRQRHDLGSISVSNGDLGALAVWLTWQNFATWDKTEILIASQNVSCFAENHFNWRTIFIIPAGIRSIILIHIQYMHCGEGFCFLIASSHWPITANAIPIIICTFLPWFLLHWFPASSHINACGGSASKNETCDPHNGYKPQSTNGSDSHRSTAQAAAFHLKQL